MTESRKHGHTENSIPPLQIKLTPVPRIAMLGLVGGEGCGTNLDVACEFPEVIGLIPLAVFAMLPRASSENIRKQITVKPVLSNHINKHAFGFSDR